MISNFYLPLIWSIAYFSGQFLDQRKWKYYIRPLASTWRRHLHCQSQPTMMSYTTCVAPSDYARSSKKREFNSTSKPTRSMRKWSKRRNNSRRSDNGTEWPSRTIPGKDQTNRDTSWSATPSMASTGVCARTKVFTSGMRTAFASGANKARPALTIWKGVRHCKESCSNGTSALRGNWQVIDYNFC